MLFLLCVELVPTFKIPLHINEIFVDGIYITRPLIHTLILTLFFSFL